MPQADSWKISDFLFSYHPVKISPRAENRHRTSIQKQAKEIVDILCKYPCFGAGIKLEHTKLKNNQITR
jgi:hypothetical protein